MDHSKSMKIMYSMARDGKIDMDIVSELDRVFGEARPESAEISEPEAGMKMYRCSVCGYIHLGEEPPAECPICDSGADKFEIFTRDRHETNI